MLNTGRCSPSQGSGKMLLFLLRNDGEIILEFNHSAGGCFTSLPSFLQMTPRVCQSPSLTLPRTPGGWQHDFRENQHRRGAATVSRWAFHSSRPSIAGLLAQASASLFPVKLILERGHHKINNEIMRILHHLAGLFSPYQRAASRGHLRPPGDVPSSLLPSPAPYISDLITCETQSGGLQCYPITKSRFIWTWEAERGFMICTAPFLSVNLFVTFIPRNFLSFLTPLHLFLTIQ